MRTSMHHNPTSRSIVAIATLAVALGSSTFAFGQDEASNIDSGFLFIKAGRVYVSPDRSIEDGCIIVRDGKIEEIGQRAAKPEGARVIDLSEGTLTAGLIDANLSAEILATYRGPENETECIPHLRVLDAFDAGDPMLERLAAGGVTTVYVGPEPSSVIGSQGAILRTGGPIEERVIHAARGVKATIGREPIFRDGFNRGPFGRVSFMTRRPTTRMGLVWTVRKSFHDAHALARGEDTGSRGEGSPTDEAIPILQGILKGDVPLRIQARQLLDIQTAFRIGQEFGLDFILEEGTEAPRCIEAIKANNVPVIYGPIYDYPRGFRASSGEVDRRRLSGATELLDAGVTLALSAGDLAADAPLAEQASFAMRYGMTRKQALAAVTTTPAKILGLGEAAGKLERGAGANLVLWTGEPFEATTRAALVIVNGHVVFDRTEEGETK